MEDIKETLSNTLSSNQLVQACKHYSKLKYVEVSLKCIAWFTYKVKLQFLDMCELTNPSDLLTLLPNLEQDLATGDYEILKDYHVDYSFKVEEPTRPLAKYILKSFAERASSDLIRQRDREYRFGEYYEYSGQGSKRIIF